MSDPNPGQPVPMQARPVDPIDPMNMIANALDHGAPIEMIEKLMGLQERWEANIARKAFEKAMAGACAEMPTLIKNRQVGFDSRGGGSRTAYKHEDLAEVVSTVAPILGKYGLSHRFETMTEPNRITVTCVIAHELGHAIRNSLSAGADTSGNKNAIQAMGSTLTYLSRYALKAALGLAASVDDDGLSAKEPVAAPDAMARPTSTPPPSKPAPAAATAAAGSPPPNATLTIPQVEALEKAARAAAARGTSEFRLFWRSLDTLSERKVVEGLGTELRRAMEETDKALMRDAAVAESYDQESGEIIEPRT
jgi:hypothetical protein